MFLTLINDCRDENAFGRQETRASILFDAHISTVGVDFGKSLEGAGNLIDVLDASEGGHGVVLVNVAPRHRGSRKWENGTPFCYFYHKETLVVSTVDEDTLSLAKKFNLASEVKLLDVPTVVSYAVKKGLLNQETANDIAVSQFRSYDFSPRAAKWIWDGIDIPYSNYSISQIPDAPHAVWHVDNFGNCKTTVLPEDVGHSPGKVLKTKVGEIKCYGYLKDVPKGEAGIVVGSSGLGDRKLLEIVVQGGSAAQKFNLSSGDKVF